MELKKLRHFLAVLETGSLAEAARRVNISQPALSKSIHSFEQAVGSRLFVRSVRGMIPTAVAQAIALRARVISFEVDRVQNEIREIQKAGRGRIAIGTGPSFRQVVLPKAIARLLHTSPNIEVTIVDGFVESLLAAVESGEIEFALLTLSPELLAAEVETELLVPRDRTLVVVSAQHPFTSRRSVSMKEAFSGSWILAREPDQLRRKLTELFARAGFPAPPTSVEFSSVSLALDILRESNLISFLPEMLLRPELDAGTLYALPIRELMWERSLGAVYRRGSSLTPAAQKLLAEIRSICRQRTARR